MSASLVGSEMCIRDSGLVDHADEVGARELVEAPLLRAIGRRAPGGGRVACLLYTSDAADDM
eukprot:15154504-Alexandrium_andersonii.AAC.1